MAAYKDEARGTERLTMSGTRDEVERWDGAIEGWGTFGD